jgi:rfaE bifunctional protein nucleotidyltransferase chain/domain
VRRQPPPPGTVLSLDDLLAASVAHRDAGRTIAWTNGCFDLLHAGHLDVLEAAAEAADVLVVGLNSDASVRELKGPARPVVPEAGRARLVAALRPVGHVTLFDGPTPLPVLQRLRPDVFVKGGDYTAETMRQDERACIESHGGRLAFVPFRAGCSTTGLLAQIRGADTPQA